MDGLWVLALLIGTAALPVALAYIWFRVAKLPVPPSWFALSLMAGALALVPAALVQYFLPPQAAFSGGFHSAAILLGILVRTALTEEGARFLALFLLFRFRPRTETAEKSVGPAGRSSPFAAATGLVAGLGFALVENAYYGAANIGVTLIRAFTAAPLHGACGARIGLAALSVREAPVRALSRFLYAVLIHGMYNFMLVNPRIPAFFPVLLAVSALASSIQVIQKR